MSTTRGGAVCLVAILALTGCTGDEGSAPTSGAPPASSAAGDDAAATYATALRDFADEVNRSVRRKPTRFANGDVKAWPDLGDVVEAPALAQVEEDEAVASQPYAVATEVAGRVASFVAELDTLGGMGLDHFDVNSPLYSLESDAYSALLDLNSGLFDAVYAGTGYDPEGSYRARRVELPKEIEVFTTMSRGVERLKFRGEIGASVESYIRDELAFNVDFTNEFIDYLDTHTAATGDPGLYAGQQVSLEIYLDAALFAPWDHWPELTKGLARGIDGLATQAEDGAVDRAGPFVGDAYREAIIELGSRRPKPDLETGAVDRWVITQAWFLHRIREIEDTPDAAYEEAEQTIMAFDVEENARSYYDVLLEVIGGLGTHYPGSSDAAQVAPFLSWAVEQLDQAAPEVLQSTADAVLEEVSAIPTTGAEGRRLTAHEQRTDAVEKLLRAASKTLDDRGEMGAAIVEAIGSTSPGAMGPWGLP